jgi:hypothetical protein
MPIHPMFEEAPKKFSEDLVGRIRTGTMLNNRPMSLQTFRLTTGDPTVADAFAEQYGGTPAEWATTKEDNLEVISTATSLNIELLSLQSGNVLFSATNTLIRSCDGIKQQDESPCWCKTQYSTQTEMNAGNKQGIACGPVVKATMKLPELPELGIFYFESQSKKLAHGDPEWTRNKLDDGEVFSEPIGVAEEALKRLGPGAFGTLEMVGVSYTQNGQAVRYTKPVLTMVEAVAA